MTRPRRPLIDLSDEDAATLRRAGFGQMVVWRWKNKKGAPSRILLPRISAALGRDVLQPAPVAASNDATVAPETPLSVNRIAPRPHIQINPCADDAVCLAVRKAAMRPVANTLLDQKRAIPCVSCKVGIARARAEAEKKVVHVGELTCPSCGEEKSREARTCHACASERKRTFRPQPLRGMKGATT